MKRFHKCIALAAACAAAAASVNAYEPVMTDAASSQVRDYAEIIVSTVNDIRASYGLPELSTTPLLIDLSTIRAEELATSFSHTRPNGEACSSLLKEEGISYSFMAENIAAGRSDPVATVDQWMQSEGHRANILGDTFTHIGIGYYYDASATYVHHWSMYLVSVVGSEGAYVYDDQYIPERELGDINGTKTINANDASIVLKYSATLAVGMEYPAVDQFKAAGDVNGDGKINALDASIILAYSSAAGSGQNVSIEDFIW